MHKSTPKFSGNPQNKKKTTNPKSFLAVSQLRKVPPI